MIKIAICDDEQHMLDKLYGTIRETFSEYDISVAIQIFINPQDFMIRCNCESYDYIFLDIDMNPINGFDIAAHLNQY